MVTKNRGLVLGATAFVLTTIAVTGAGLRLSQSQASYSDNSNPKELIDQVWQIINNTYVDGTFNQVDWRTVRTEYLKKPYASQEDAYPAIREMLKQLGDPYTRFMNPQEFQNMQIDTSGELTGVGIQITKDEKSERLVVVSPIEDTPAFKAGILSKDIILKIDGKDTQGMDVEDAVKLIRGKPGTSVTLTIERDAKEVKYTLNRTKIEIHPVKERLVENTPIGKVGYIRLTQFSSHAGDEMRDAIKKLESDGVKGYVLDLRSNPGGLLYASVEIARMWIDEGKIVSTVNRQGESEQQRANGTALTQKPLVVLVDGGSASASEILSGALQDHHRAKLVGTKTFGKGLVQSVRELQGGSGLAVTIAKYLTPDGRDINKHGIEPDIEVPLTDEARKTLQKDNSRIGTLDDPQYVKAYEELQKEVIAKEGGVPPKTVTQTEKTP